MSVLDAGVGSKWSLALDGEGYILSTLDQESPFEMRAYTIGSISDRVPRIDQSTEPGEQSLGALWPRAQRTFHHGVGQDIFDGDDSDTFKTKMVKGMDPFVKMGTLQPHSPFEYIDISYQDNPDHNGLVTGPDNKLVFMLSVDTDQNQPRILKLTPTAVSGNRTDGFTFVLHASKVAVGPTSSVWGHSRSYVMVGKTLYWGVDDGMFEIDLNATWPPTATKKNNLTFAVILGYVKGRFILCKSDGLHEITDLTSPTDGATAFWNHTESVQWEDITESGPAIYVTGAAGSGAYPDFAGGTSYIWAIGFDDTDLAAGLTIGVPRVVWTAPEGEQVKAIKGYRGKAVLIATTKGMRNGLVLDNGDLEVSGILTGTNNPLYIRDILINGNFAYFPIHFWDPTSSTKPHIGLGSRSVKPETLDEEIYYIGKMDLSNFSWSPALIVNQNAGGTYTSGGTNPIESMTWYQPPIDVVEKTEYGDSRSENPWMIFSGLTDSVFGIHNLNSKIGGYIETGIVRFGTTERKTLRVLDLQLDLKMKGLKLTGAMTTPTPVIATNKTTGKIEFKFLMRAVETRSTMDLDLLTLDYPNSTHPFSVKCEIDSGKQKLSYRETDGTLVTKIATTAIDTEISGNEYNTDWFVLSYVIDLDTGDIDFWIIQEAEDDYWNLTDKADAKWDNYESFAAIGATSIIRDTGGTARGAGPDTMHIRTLGVSLDGDSVAEIDTSTYEPDLEGRYWTLTTGDGVDAGTFDVWVEVDDAEPTKIFSAIGHGSHSFTRTVVGREFNFLFEPTDIDSNVPALSGWRVKSEPLVDNRILRYEVPIQLFDRMTTLDGQKIDRPGYAVDQLAKLTALYRGGRTVDIQLPSYYHDSEVVKVKVKDMLFKTYAPGGDGFGGICLLYVEEQE